MKNRKEELNVMMNELIDRVEYAKLESEDRVEEMAKIDGFIEHLFELVSELQGNYDELDRLEKEYQAKRAELQSKVSQARNIFARRKTEDSKREKLIALSYEISDAMNKIRAKERRSESDEQTLRELQDRLEEVFKKLQ